MYRYFRSARRARLCRKIPSVFVSLLTVLSLLLQPVTAIAEIYHNDYCYEPPQPLTPNRTSRQCRCLLKKSSQAVCNPPPCAVRLRKSRRPSGALPAYPLNHVLDKADVTLGVPPANHTFEAPILPGDASPTNYDFRQLLCSGDAANQSRL
ncbi:MAG: hypothetical protein R2867_01200 [Caldilineaceae bacterium]